MYFSVSLAKILKILFLKNTSRQLLLKLLLKQFWKFSPELKTPYNIIFSTFLTKLKFSIRVENLHVISDS